MQDKIAELEGRIHKLEMIVRELYENPQVRRAPEVHIKKPIDGVTTRRDFTAEGHVRPYTHTVKVSLYCMQTGQSSDVIDAVVNSATGDWTAGPFTKNGQLLNPGAGCTLSATSYSAGSQADNDSVSQITITN